MPRLPFRLSPANAIFLSMPAGLLIGLLFPQAAGYLEPLSTIFIRLVKSLVVPIVFATLVVGIAGHSDLKAVGKMGVKTLIYFEVVTTFALLIGLAMGNILKPGMGIHLEPAREMLNAPAGHMTITEVVVNIFPQNVIDSAARGDLLEVVVFTVIFSAALYMVDERKKKTLLEFCDALSEAMFKYTAIVMKFAPIGVGAAIAVIVGSKGTDVLLKLGMLIFSCYLSIIVFMALVLLPILLFYKVPFRPFISAVKGPAVIAFSTSSSEAALPKAMQAMEELGVPRRIVSFVIPTGYSFNLDGTTIFLSLAALFAAQAAGIELTMQQQFIMGFSLIFASKGAAGIPRASLVVLAGTLASFSIPMSAVALILGVDAVMDMARSATNVVGNCLATAVMARMEGEQLVQPAAVVQTEMI